MCSFLFEQRKNIQNITMDEHTISSNSSSNNINTIINNFQGDLTDIVRLRPGGVAGLVPASSSSSNSHHHHPHLDVVSGYEEDLLLHNMSNDNTNNSSGGGGGGGGAWQLFSSADPLMMNYFGDPFSNLRPDPLLHHHMTAAAPGLFGSPNSSSPTRASDLVNGGGGGVGFCSGVNGLVGPSHEDMNMMSSTNSSGGGISGRPSCNIFSRMLQINPTSANSCSSTPTTAIASKLPCNSNTTTNTTSSSQGGDSPSPSPPPPSMAVASPRGINVNSSQQGGCLVDNNSSGGHQISSPRNPGIKRRKSQAKKVVCIPAPAAANSRATGEVVPSDLWAWRKYGQKPIKGSPYPRGYYRCSSSKGCSARKQVERSRTDPNMLVITYTSEHNHPWPTQRNALAGSTRSQPSKNTPNSIKNTPLMSSQLQKSNVSSPKEDSAHQLNNNKEMGMMTHSQNDNSNAVVGGGGSTSSTTSASVKEENVDHEVHDYDHEIDEKLDQLDDSSCHDHQFNSDEVVGLFPYRPTMPGPNPTAASADQDFFADLGEIEADPLNLLFSQGFNSVDHDHQHKGMLISKGLDPFNLFDWSGGGGGGDNNNNNTNK
ncbi:probable WRKY transcription factor 14 [Humulus lupulus]|uniref:probable WRKY transcription factor 14 n=1 Tax=Humulus lupulus TaxID=3486 RepID=UPI002B403AFA|nr:probable WRKY transcription factor 14 [Humulus lupulus]